MTQAPLRRPQNKRSRDSMNHGTNVYLEITDGVGFRDPKSIPKFSEDYRKLLSLSILDDMEGKSSFRQPAT